MKRPVLPTILLVVAATAALAFTAGRASPPQAVIAYVDMSKVIESLDENAARTEEVNVYGRKLEEDLKAEEKRIKEEEESLNLLPHGPERRAKGEELARRKIVLAANGEVSARLFNRRKVQALHDLYTKVDQAAEELAKARGYTMVLASDEGIVIPGDDLENFQRAAALKQALFIDPRHDITDELVTFMNNQYAAAGGKAPARPAAASKPAAGGAKK